jgi:glycosyltransferase 2 family protein
MAAVSGIAQPVQRLVRPAPPPVPRWDTMPAAQDDRSRRRWTRLLGWAASIAILLATAALLRERFTAVGAAGGLPGLAPSALAVILFTIANGVLADTWQRMMALSGPALPWRAAAWIWSASQLARYTVGAAQVGGRAILARRYGLTATAGAASVVVEVGWQVSLNAATVLLTLPWWLPGAGDLTWLAWAGIAPVLVLVWGLVAPQHLIRAVARGLSLGPLGRLLGDRLERVATTTQLSRAAAAGLTGRFLLNTGLRMIAFVALFAGVAGRPVGRDDVLLAIGAYAVGSFVGRLAVFAPGGLGPREGATALVVAPAIGGGPALVLVAAVRLLELVAELLFLLIARVLRPTPEALEASR